MAIAGEAFELLGDRDDVTLLELVRARLREFAVPRNDFSRAYCETEIKRSPGLHMPRALRDLSPLRNKAPQLYDDFIAAVAYKDFTPPSLFWFAVIVSTWPPNNWDLWTDINKAIKLYYE
jgi:hypothetical protein